MCPPINETVVDGGLARTATWRPLVELEVEDDAEALAALELLMLATVITSSWSTGEMR